MTVANLWSADPGLEREVGDQFDRAIRSYEIHPDLIEEHANHEESIRTGGYANRTLLELVQNSADALAGAEDGQGPTAGRVEITLDVDKKTLYCANAGRPFSESGLRAITMAYLSAKRGDEIGRFGLGFKSVLAVSDSPQVFSRSISFEFNSVKARKALTKVGPGAKRYPILRTATVADPLAEFAADPILADLAEWATTIVKLPNATNLKRLTEEMRGFSPEFLLFVNAVREVKLRIIGPEAFETSHISRDLGDGVLKIERPDGEGEEWFVQDRMHSPSEAAREQVGQAVSRKRVKVTVALPARQSRQRIGRFWAYFPLQDETSASALFNAPWSVNDDRTTLLHNDYNREILRTLSKMFVDLLPRTRTTEDPAAHLDYMPARGRELLSFGDELLIAHIPVFAAEQGIIPDANGVLKHATDLRPLDFSFALEPSIHQAWIESPNTGEDVPSWRCYATSTRTTRLRDLFTAGLDRGDRGSARDTRRALELMPKRGLLSWLREWADGVDPISSENAFKTVCALHRKIEGVDQAKVIPTTEGLRALVDKDVVFLSQDADIEIEGATFVDPIFLARPGVDDLLRKSGFRDLDPLAVLNARLAKLPLVGSDQELTKLWDAVMGVPVLAASKALAAHAMKVRVPTVDGGWSLPRQVFDVSESLGPSFASRTLDRSRCLPEVAYQLGVIRGPVRKFPADDEPAFDRYKEWVLTTLNQCRGPGERPTERIDLTPYEGPGPFSMLFMLRDADASDELRARWTAGLLAEGDGDWICEDLDTSRTYPVKSPVRWAVERAGLLRTNRGFRAPADVVAPSLVKYEGLLPLFKGPGHVSDALELPDELAVVPVKVLRDALGAEIFPPAISDSTLVDFILTADRIAYPESHPPSIPARVRKAVEARPPNAVYLATTDEQQEYLSHRHRPYLRVSEEEAADLAEAVGCRRFEESFAFSVLVEGRQDSERIVDVYPGLRSTLWAEKVAHATVARALLLAKRVTTEEGVEDQAIDWHLEGGRLIVANEADERKVLSFINDAFEMRLNNAELATVIKAGVDHRLETMRQEAIAAPDDESRLEVYIGPDDLREALPSGLWQALQVQGLVGDDTSVARLFLTVYGSEAVKQLQENFRQLGFPDVPTTWGGGASTISWLRKMGFGAEYAGRRSEPQVNEFIVPGAVKLNPLHEFQQRISEELQQVITQSGAGRSKKAMLELPTGSGKTRVASETVLRLFIEGKLRGPVLWIAQSQELCEQAVQTWGLVWRGLGDERPLTIGRLWESNIVHEPDTEFSVIVATDAKLNVVRGTAEYEWLSEATLVIVDEGHRAGNSSMYTSILQWLGVAGTGWARPLVGLSATPFKGTSESATKQLANRFGNKIIKAFEGDAYHELAELGVLARVKHDVLPGIKVRLYPSEVAEASRLRRINPAVLDRIGRDQARMAILIDHIMSQDDDWPILVFTPNVLSAQVLAASLRYRDVRAESVSGQTSRQVRRDVIQKFKDGAVRVLANCDLLIQGFDAPGVRALYIARPTFSPSAYIQMAGRGLRGPANGGKEECLIVDMADDFGNMSNLLGYREYEPLWKEHPA
ncbi:DEAD/DEAH box helicase family protein [Actinopolymorpha sp. NPDC004070]|uniref:sacsin N-terminal ATP-binding-like domain-containing protein n=1 Tax=Actinopolymorpha sp. NPDC004070 TaxID=3154548 RepID=UPI0033B192DE